MTKTILARSLPDGSIQKKSRIRSGLARKLLFKLLSTIKDECFVIVENDKSYVFGSEQSALIATLEIHNPKIYINIMMQGDIALGEAYMRGDVTTPNLVAVVRVLVRQQTMFARLAKLNFFTGHLLLRTIHRLRKNSIKGSKKNITAHYDLGNDFFETFLDSTMMYSSGIYCSSSTTLEEASINKLKIICDNLQISPDDHLLEIGTGWGALAIYASKNYGCKVTTTTISHEQYQHAKDAVEKADLADLVTVLDKDYRDLQGQYDKIVSVEMIEAVGHQYLSNYLKKINSLLKSGGEVLLQAIMLPDQKYDRARHHADFIKTHIFPGGFLPSMNAILAETKKSTSLNLVDYLDITQSYAYTLRDWREKFDANEAQIDALGYPEPFRRLWRFYLSYCEGGFEERAIFCSQIKLEKSKLV